MTIKQQGGVFGRNPTFNDVTVEGSLSVSGDPVLVDADIGVTVQGYDADTAKLDVAQTFTANQRIDANVGIRTDPSILLGQGLHITSVDYANLTLQKGTPAHGQNIDFVDDTGALEFRVGTNFASGGTNFLVAHTSGLAFKIDTSRDVTVTNGNLIIGTSGKGIDFSATSNGSGTTTSELFADYEFGSFTPTLATGAGQSITYTGQYGRYTRIGDQVFCSGVIVISALSAGSSTHMQIQGLPFVTNSQSGAAPIGEFSYGTSYNNTCLFTVSDISGVELQSGNAAVALYRAGQSGTSTIYVRSSELQVGMINFHLSYRTNA